MASQQSKPFEQTKRPNQIIRIQSGRELDLNVSTDISCGLSFMNPAYRQAERAVLEIMHQTKRFHKYAEERERTDSDRGWMDDLLFQYSGNIIAFVGSKGNGKTRTMLSFAKCLSSNGDQIECLEFNKQCVCGVHNAVKCSECALSIADGKFITCTPISPATLEGKQNILYVVLSRLYSMAEELLEQDLRGRRISEQDKGDLYAAFRRCLSGINGIKNEQDNLSDFSILREIGDGLSLQRRFHDLVQVILRIAARKQDAKYRYLVLQLDDTDSKGDKVWDVFEDVRKYLQIPNLIILLSTDMEITYNLILQHHMEQCQTLLATDKKDYLVEEWNRATRKYVDKLIPPSHMIHLPQVQRVAEENSDRLLLQYVKEQNEQIVPVFDWMTMGVAWSLQDAVLSLIYRKTGVLFAAPSSYLHNIIPRTLRGLNQLLYLLRDMEQDLDSLTEEDFKDSVTFATAVLRQCAVAEKNLRRFTEYFNNTWIKAKIQDVKDAEFLKRLYETASINRVRLAVWHLSGKYTGNRLAYQTYSFYELDELMAEIEKVNRTQDDFLLLFAIRTMFTLESHRLIWSRKRVQAEKWLAAPHEGQDVLFFDYELKEIQARDMIRSSKYRENVRVNDEATKTLEHPEYLIFNLQFNTPVDKSFYAKLPRYSQQVLLRPGLDERNIEFNLFNCFNLPLRLTKLLKQRTASTGRWMDLTQKQAYWMQELALLIVANWDVQAKLYKEVDVYPKEEDTLDQERTPSGKISALLNAAFKMIRKLNSGKLEYVSPALWTVLAESEQSYQGLKELMYEAAEDYEAIKDALVFMWVRRTDKWMDGTDKDLIAWLDGSYQVADVSEQRGVEEQNALKDVEDTSDMTQEVEQQSVEQVIQKQLNDHKGMSSWFKEMLDEAEKTANALKLEEIAHFRKKIKLLDSRVYRRKQKMRNMAELPEEERRQLAEKTMISLDALRQELLALGEKICAL